MIGVSPQRKFGPRHVLAPQCIFELKTTPNLGAGIKLIKEHGSLFAVRSGGHMTVPGAQSVNDGVMISTSNFHEKSLSEDNWLAQHGLAVNGGRYPMVGVGGVLLGGGMGYFAGQRGWSVDDLMGWEVALADGSIVNVTASLEDPYSDLAWALRGGHNHFGIVTRFDMRIFTTSLAYGGLVMYGAAAKEPFFAALDAYMAPGGDSDDPKSAINPASTLQFVDGEWNPRALENFTNIPTENVAFGSAALHDSWVDIPNSLAAMASREDRTLFWAITFKSDRRAVDIVTQMFYAGASKELKHTALVAGILFPTWKLARDDNAVYGFTRKAALEMEEKLRTLNLFNPDVYINDAAKGQRPFEMYAGGAHLARLQGIQVQYDPDGFMGLT
ncbi:hypothetical protein EV127DRAFT_513848 [Xylaria flabelliformis]|nr:hypothetical protein EV127DRAFT_513848 [Xylaria flabelliformis]